MINYLEITVSEEHVLKMLLEKYDIHFYYVNNELRCEDKVEVSIEHSNGKKTQLYPLKQGVKCQ